jgi:DinB superfamily
MASSPGLTLAVQRLSEHIKNVPAEFNHLPEKELLQRPAPGKWSKQEIIGHLVDSAINNLKRFTDTQCLPQPYTVIGYRQDELVRFNNYQQLSLAHILSLWSALNTQIINVINNVPADKILYTVISSGGESKTLEWLIIDYVDHMEHHLKQVFG